MDATVGRLNVEFNVDLQSLHAGMEAAEQSMGQCSQQAGQAFNAVDGEAVKAGKSVSDVGDKATETGQDFDEMGKTSSQSISDVGQALVALGAVKVFQAIFSEFKECIDASIEFESALTGVAKTTDLTSDELTSMGGEFKKLSTEIPVAASEIAGIAENAGQLGIEKKSILGFTETMADLGATTCKCYSKKGPKRGTIVIEKSPTCPPKSASVVG